MGTDYVMEVRHDDDSIYIIFPHFAIEENTKKTIPSNKNNIIKNVSIGNTNAKWVYEKIEEYNVEVPLYLYTIKDEIYITISSAKSFEEKDFEKIMGSLVKLVND
ncbi:hypothetical protein BHF71_07220 [Vulcanibacillus modesticaldus]|uniref:DUF4367 domain-containing protein n=1 Tax=Vulcanibacillus modesticaldus TaxID=337097 RepID=A0A1D2YVZ1_9BACI|nr:hypothetical protein [Vulcanibacillus modesticaldus]OEF99894.1 hypothetical protein BHF71_07220 [Vulcanibacillus modesticaldus]